MRKLFFTIALLFAFTSYSQVVINEIDADTPSTDDKEFVELKSATPNFPLDGYVLVFFNGTSSGTGNLSYYAIDLDSYITDVNGIIHFGNALVSPTPAILVVNAMIQNGPDVVALYQGNDVDFPLNTPATNTGLIDALAYSNGATVQPTALMTVFGLSTCVNENEGSAAATKSIQRKNDGTYEVKTPTPGMNNDGSGIVLTYLSLTVNTTTITEGESFNITFTSTQPITGSPLVINFSLNNGSFNSNDFSGTTSVTIPVGATVGTRTIQILNEGNNEGDEELKITANSIPTN